MKKFVCILLLLVAKLCSAQQRPVEFSFSNHRIAAAVKPSLADSLAKHLTASFTSESEKVHAIFRWITDNISYQVVRIPYYRAGRRNHIEPEDTSTTFISLDERVANAVIYKREAVCDGYARLFKTLCDYAGIRAEVITGYARTNMTRNPQFRSNHKWNAVMIDSAWYLLDATWASGYFNFADQFVQSYDDRFYLASPQSFINDHYPEDLQWTLLKNPPALREFRQMPFRYTGFFKTKIAAYAPASGVIEASVGDTLVFEVAADDKEKKLWVTDSLYVDTATVSVFAGLPKPVNKIQYQKVSYKYIVPSEAIEWLYVIYNDEMVMRYKLDVNKRFTTAKTDKQTLQINSE